MTGRNALPPAEKSRHVLRMAAIALATIAVLAFILIAAGVFDPKPFGSLTRVDRPGPFTLSEAGEATHTQSSPWPSDAAPLRFSTRLTAAYQDGEMDSGYGLSLISESGRLVVAVSPLGYATVRETLNTGDEVAHLPWQPWPHVHSRDEENKLWLDVDNTGDQAHVTAWINRERLWQGELDDPVTMVELWQTTFGLPVTVDYRTLEWYAEQRTNGAP